MSASDPVGAVIDLRAYARGTAPSHHWQERAAPAFADGKARVAAVALRGTGHVDALPDDECVLVLAGQLSIDGAGGSLALAAGQAGVVPVGASFDWRASEDLLAIVYAAPTAAPGTPDAIVAIDTDAPLTPSGAPAPENLLGPVPQCRNHTDYLSANTEFVCGTWDSTPYHRRQIRYAQVEMMFLLGGRVTFTDAHASVTFGAGDACLFVRGDGCAWLSEEHVKKIYATQRPVA